MPSARPPPARAGGDMVSPRRPSRRPSRRPKRSHFTIDGVRRHAIAAAPALWTAILIAVAAVWMPVAPVQAAATTASTPASAAAALPLSLPLSPPTPSLLSPDHFASLVTRQDPAHPSGTWFVLFGASWCPYTQALLPHWTAVAQRWQQQHARVPHVALGRIECSGVGGGSSSFCIRQPAVSGYPTILIYTDGVLREKYTGGDDENKLWQRILRAETQYAAPPAAPRPASLPPASTASAAAIPAAHPAMHHAVAVSMAAAATLRPADAGSFDRTAVRADAESTREQAAATARRQPDRSRSIAVAADADAVADARQAPLAASRGAPTVVMMESRLDDMPDTDTVLPEDPPPRSGGVHASYGRVLVWGTVGAAVAAAAWLLLQALWRRRRHNRCSRPPRTRRASRDAFVKHLDPAQDETPAMC
ncbi:hypothetical protein CXG81DRAFT_19559 [Caulochytrium protostelioides]|uniref:Thioredoxin domain-containing protein n=1 Tax=Caulochytrium protostelioides TaxID=1555241 RepID=A0A4P9X5R4_9FUNG|nr:hypothetical protein CXG81DRAFT_19559 [Caulochytrium protostelioides]|eukprot:RKP00487.1 hypothetical protein CXG81DRAFT_19559 [Caulochytrium protostelioides]